MRAFLRWTLIMSLVVGFSGCSNSKDDSSSSQNKIEQANERIDQGRYDDAIAILQELRNTDSSPRVAMVLASAYAARAGVKVEKYWGFVVGYKPLMNTGASKDEFAKPFLDPTLLPSSAPKEAREFLSGLNDNMRELMKWQARVSEIPYIERKQRDDLQEAANVLEGADTPGAHMYRALLETILLRSGLDDTSAIAAKLIPKKLNLCSKQAKDLLEWVAYCRAVLINALNDAIVAYPDNQKDLARVLEQVQGFDLPETETVCGSAS